MKKSIALFFAGSLASGGLFQFDIGLPSFHATQYAKQQTKLTRSREAIRKQRTRLSKGAMKKAGKRAAGSLVPFVGTLVTLGLAAEEYCEDLGNLVELSNILADEQDQEQFDLRACLEEAERSITTQLE